MTDTALRAKKVAQITALLQKTEAKGCTAEEALAARRMANTLMTKYSITEAECQPQERVSSFPGGFSWSDLFKNAGYTYPTAEQPKPQEDTKRANARAAYHRSGVHIDDESFAEGCQCRRCKRRRQPKQQPYQAKAKCDCPSCSGTGPTYNGFKPEAGFYADPSTSYGPGPTKPKRKQTSHANCSHENTKAARARCRRGTN